MIERNVGAELTAQGLFSASLEDVRKNDIKTVDYSVFTDNLVRDGRVGVMEGLLPEKDGFYISNNNNQDDLKGLPDRMRFSLQAGLEVGRENSRNGVFFGTLSYDFFNNHGYTNDQIVAVKPFIGVTKHRYLAQELAVMHTIHSMGLECSEVVGLVRSKNDLYLISKFKPDVITLDSLDWQNLPKNDEKNVINRSLRTLFELHQNGIFHGDSEPKNLTIQPDQTKNWHVDFEYSVATETPAQTLRALMHDLRNFYYGMCKLQKNVESFDDMYSRVLLPYISNIKLSKETQSNKSVHTKEIETLFPLVCESFAREYENEPMTENEREYKLGCLAAKFASHRKTA